MNFDTAFSRLIGNEGGYVNNPVDPGGETNWGISKRSYPNIDIKNLTRDQAAAIYLLDFWNVIGNIDPALKFQVFDAAVNHGIGTALRMLQRAAGVADDGHIGPVTVAAVSAKPLASMLMLFVATRIRFWTKLSSWPTFGAGWANRAATNLEFAAGDAA